MSEALYNYRVRVSPRSRNVRLKVTLQHGLEVVIPCGYDEGKIPSLLKRKKQWINSALERAESYRKFFEPEPVWRLPIQVKLPAIGMGWHVTARETDARWVAVREIDQGRLLVFGAIDDEQACRAALARWLQRQAHEYLVPRLKELSRGLGLKFRRAYIKRQRTRWASCSRHKAITLNVKLLFLQPELVRYVMVHELCHLAEMNHSRRFWALVHKNHAEFQAHDKELREGWKKVPRWAG